MKKKYKKELVKITGEDFYPVGHVAIKTHIQIEDSKGDLDTEILQKDTDYILDTLGFVCFYDFKKII